MRASFETSDAPYERVVSSAMHAVQWHCQHSDVEAELSRAKPRVRSGINSVPPEAACGAEAGDAAAEGARDVDEWTRELIETLEFEGIDASAGDACAYDAWVVNGRRL